MTTTGIVTAVDTNGFYLQDATGDGNIATSDALFVFTGGAPGVFVGDELEVEGTVSEFFPGGEGTGNLSTTQLSGSPKITTISTGNTLPAATLLGQGGRMAPAETIDDDALASFDPVTDGIDFFESLEGMLVTAQDLVAVSGTNRFGEIFAVTDQGANATGRSSRGTLNISPDDFNPEKIQIDEDTGILPGFSLPAVDVGARLGDVTGVISYDFGNFQIHPTEQFTVIDSALEPEVTAIVADADTLTVASYNMLNLDPVVEQQALTNNGEARNVDDDIGDGRFSAIAQQIVTNLNAPDIIGLQEIQDNTGGEIVDDVVSASETLQRLIDEIVAAGGPTYAFIDNTFITDEASGGQPGGNIRTAFLYNSDRVGLVDGTVQTIGSQELGGAFEGARLPLVAAFAFNGEEVTVVNNHFSSKGGSAPILGREQPFESRQEDLAVNGSLDERQAQSAAVQAFVAGILAQDAAAKVAVLGDFNEFEFVSPVTGLETAGLTNLTNSLPEDERYSFIFQGNSQSLDHILVSDSLLGSAAFDVVHVNVEFAETPGRASDHEPLVAGLTIAPAAPELFTLELLHLADQEAGIPALDDAPRASAVLAALEAQDLGNDGLPDNTLKLSSGDTIIPGLFFSASQEVFGGAGRADILIQNELGLQAIAFGNHEFDLGTGLLADLIGGDPDDGFAGAQFPYLSSNLDFTTDGNLAPFVTTDGQAPQPNSIDASIVIDVNGEKIGVVGATTPTVDVISSPGDVSIFPADFDGSPSEAQLDALAAEIQADVDALLAANPEINKVVLLSHMQQLSIERALAGRLSHVDIIVGGGSNTRLVDGDDALRAGDSPQGPYPILETDADGNPVAVVNTDGNYKYIGRLVVDFDANGVIVPESYDEAVSGAYRTDDAGVGALGAEGLIDPEIQTIVDQLRELIEEKESNVFGVADVYLDGRRGSVRTQETNLGNLTADANLAEARKTDPTVVISLKNGGGIRDDIGRETVPAGGTGEAELLPNEEIPGVKPEGGVSETDIANALRFNNGLTLLTLTGEGLKAVLEHAVAASSLDDANTQGRFPQIGGMEVSFDLTEEAGSRIKNVAVQVTPDIALQVVEDGVVINPDAEFRMVTLGFLAGGGDGYPFPTFGSDFVDLAQPEAAPRTGVAEFAPDGSEQDALAEYLAANFNPDNGGAPFAEAETPRELDERLQNLAFREDMVDGFDFLEVAEAGSRGALRVDMSDGDVALALGDILGDGVRQRVIIDGFGEGDEIFVPGGDGPTLDLDDVRFVREAGPNLLDYLEGGDRDSLFFRGAEEADVFGPLLS